MNNVHLENMVSCHDIQQNIHHIVAKVEGEDVKEGKRDGENAEEDVAHGQVRNENVPRRHHVLEIYLRLFFSFFQNRIVR